MINCAYIHKNTTGFNFFFFFLMIVCLTHSLKGRRSSGWSFSLCILMFVPFSVLFSVSMCLLYSSCGCLGTSVWVCVCETERERQRGTKAERQGERGACTSQLIPYPSMFPSLFLALYFLRVLPSIRLGPVPAYRHEPRKPRWVSLLTSLTLFPNSEPVSLDRENVRHMVLPYREGTLLGSEEQPVSMCPGWKDLSRTLVGCWQRAGLMGTIVWNSAAVAATSISSSPFERGLNGTPPVCS